MNTRVTNPPVLAIHWTLNSAANRQILPTKILSVQHPDGYEEDPFPNISNHSSCSLSRAENGDMHVRDRYLEALGGGND